MGLFDFLRREKIPNENRSKPFHRNKNAAERKDWFSRTRPWHKVDSRIIDALISKFGEDPMFEVFVITSMEGNIVKCFESLDANDTEGVPDLICSQVALLLTQVGSKAAGEISEMINTGRINERRFGKLYPVVLNTLEPALILDSNQLGAILPLIPIKMLTNKNPEALGLIEKGLTAIQTLRVSDAPFHKSSLASIRGINNDLDLAEQLLISFRQDITGV